MGWLADFDFWVLGQSSGLVGTCWCLMCDVFALVLLVLRLCAGENYLVLAL